LRAEKASKLNLTHLRTSCSKEKLENTLLWNNCFH